VLHHLAAFCWRLGGDNQYSISLVVPFRPFTMTGNCAGSGSHVRADLGVTTRPGSPSVVLCPLTHGIWLYLLSTAYLHPGLYLGPVLNPCPSCRCPQIPILGYRTLTKRPRARSRLTTSPSFHTSRREIYPRRTRVNGVAERSPSPGMQILSTLFGAFVCQLCTCAIRSQMFIALS
jgi:hypothetical protein